MRRFIRLSTLPLLLLVAALPARSHELWIEPLAWQADPGEQLQADLINGQNFEGVRLPYLANSIVLFNLYSGGQATRVENRPGSRPALDQPAGDEGLHVVAYQSAISKVNYDEWEGFQRFAEHKDLGDVEAMHEARGLPRENFNEAYTRYSKSLIAVGSGEGSDRRLGLETELVALDNPYTAGTETIRVQLFYQGRERADEQVEIFERAPSGEIEVTTTRTDGDGIAAIPVKPGHDYMLDAVVLREPTLRVAEQTGAVWETLWANLTFHAP